MAENGVRIESYGLADTSFRVRMRVSGLECLRGSGPALAASTLRRPSPAGRRPGPRLLTLRPVSGPASQRLVSDLRRTLAASQPLPGLLWHGQRTRETPVLQSQVRSRGPLQRLTTSATGRRCRRRGPAELSAGLSAADESRRLFCSKICQRRDHGGRVRKKVSTEVKLASTRRLTK
jgi:hypothetical protein